MIVTLAPSLYDPASRWGFQDPTSRWGSVAPHGGSWGLLAPRRRTGALQSPPWERARLHEHSLSRPGGQSRPHIARALCQPVDSHGSRPVNDSHMAALPWTTPGFRSGAFRSYEAALVSWVTQSPCHDHALSPPDAMCLRPLHLGMPLFRTRAGGGLCARNFRRENVCPRTPANFRGRRIPSIGLGETPRSFCCSTAPCTGVE